MTISPRSSSPAAARAVLPACALLAAAVLGTGCNSAAHAKTPPKNLADVVLGLPIEPGPAAELGYGISWAQPTGLGDKEKDGEVGHLRVLGDLVVAVEKHGDRVTAYDAKTGVKRWVCAMGETFQELKAPVRYRDTIYVNTEGRLYGIDAVTGAISASVELATPVASEPAVLENFLVFSGLDGKVVFFNLNTNYPTWSYQLRNSIRTHPVVFGKSAFAVDSAGKYAMLSLDRHELAWVGHTWGPVVVDPVLYKDTLMVCSVDGTVYGINRSTGQDIWKYADLQKKRVRDSLFVVPAFSQVLIRVPNEGLRILSITNGTEVGRLPIQGVPVATAPSGRVILHDTAKNTLVLTEMPSGRGIVTASVMPLDRVVPTEDGALFLLGQDGQLVRLNPTKR